MIPSFWQQAKAHLSAADPVMGELIARYQGEALRGKDDAFYTLARSIAGQQISVKAAESVWKRVEPRIVNRDFGDVEALRSLGLSRQKIAYLQSLDEFFRRENIGAGHWDAMSDEEVIRHITQVKGIGRWSAEMFLIFHLLRPDVFPVDDLGLQKAITLHYGDASIIRSSDHPVICSWQPYRSVATWYLWRSLDPVPVEY